MLTKVASASGRPAPDARRCALAIVALHPVQYHSPLYRKIFENPNINSEVIYLDQLGPDGVYDQDFQNRGGWDVPLLDGYKYRFLKNYARSGFFTRMNPGLFSAIRKGRYDVVHIQGYTDISMWLGLIAAKLSGARVIWRGEVVIRSAEVQTATKKWLKRNLVGLIAKRCDAVLYTCSGNREFLDAIGVAPDKLYPFPCAVDNEFMQESRRKFTPLRARTRADLGIPNDDFVIIYCGRFTRGKRIADLMEAVRRVADTKITVLLVGEGPARRELEDFAATYGVSARFVGFIDQTELGRYYTIADLFVILSEHDRSPKTLNEAMNFALPVIVTNVVGTADDLVIDGENGFLVDVGDVNTVAAKIKLLANDVALSSRMGKRSEEIVESFNFDVDVAGLVKACHDVLAAK